MQSTQGMKHLFIALAFVAAVGTILPAQSKRTIQLPLHLTGTVISAGGVGNPTGTARVEITVNRWSTTPERTHLVDALTKDGQDKLLRELRGEKSVGTIRFNTELAYDLRYSREIPQEEGGTRVFLATDRPMSVAELWNQPRYSQYPFTLIDLRFDADGGATGSLLLAARVTADKDGRFIQVENFASEPIPFRQLQIESRR
jgi:hypothetical protein